MENQELVKSINLYSLFYIYIKDFMSIVPFFTR